MKRSFFISSALGCGWLLSPESLVITGNTAGNMGWFSLIVLLAAALLFALCNHLLAHPRLPSASSGEYLILQQLTGTVTAAGLTVAAVVPLTILAATALLVTSGYTFNEVFFYWFPNFGFAFLLLTLLTLLHFMPEKYSHWSQIVFTTITAGGLFTLSLYGLLHSEKSVTEILHRPETLPSTASALPLLLFAGITLAPPRKSPAPIVPLAGCILLFFWIMASLTYIPPERLSTSTIPYMTTARTIMGEPGRQIMGLVVISGSCAAINALMLLSKHMLLTISPSFLPRKSSRWAIPLCLALITGILLATGLAGEELLETLLHSALILWLCYYAIRCLATMMWLKNKTGITQTTALFYLIFLTAGLFTLIFNNPHTGELCIILLVMFSISTLLAGICLFINKKEITS